MQTPIQRMDMIIKRLLDFSPRQGKNEIKAYQYLVSLLNTHTVPHTVQEFQTTIPTYHEVSLQADEIDIPCRGCGLESGTITRADQLISSLFDYDDDIYFPSNINFNPRNGTTISTPLLYKHAAIAICARDVDKIINATNIQGKIVVKPYTFTSHNILVGNTTNPSVLAITHYDGLDGGAVDNASGVSVLMDILLHEKHILDNSLFVFAGNEELSYNMPLYWGNGYREFQKKYNNLFMSVKRIVAIDSVGYEKPMVNTDLHRIQNAFPFDNVDQLASKMAHICCSFSGMMSFYHSEADKIDLVKPEFLELAKNLTTQQIIGLT